MNGRIVIARDKGLENIPGAIVRTAPADKAPREIPRKASRGKPRRNPKDGDLPLARTIKPKRIAPSASKPENVTFRQVVDYAESLGLWVFHIPEVLLEGAFGGRLMTGDELLELQAAADEVSGFPDAMIFDPRRHGIHLAIEQKTEIGKVRPNQKNWKAVLGGHVCRTFDESKIVIDNWMKGTP